MVKGNNDGPVEEFRRITEAAMRAIGRNAEISVRFSKLKNFFLRKKSKF